MSAPALALRLAAPGDRDCVLAWSNEPGTRSAGFHTAPIGPEEHARWFAETLRGPRRLYIAELDGRAVGMARLDPDGDAAVVSLALAPEHRGRGLGTPLLAALIAEARANGVARLVALVRCENAPSRRLFEKCRFELCRSEQVRGAEAVRYELRLADRSAAGKKKEDRA